MGDSSQVPLQKEIEMHMARSPYQKIANEIRSKVIYDIVFQEKSIKHTALKYGLKYSTANGIIQTYSQQGRCEKKDKRNKKSFFKRNQILLTIDVETGDINFFESHTSSNVIIVEEDYYNRVGQIRMNQFEYFNNQSQCINEFVNQGLKTISEQLLPTTRKNLTIKKSDTNQTFQLHQTLENLDQNKFLNSTIMQTSDAFKNFKQQQHQNQINQQLILSYSNYDKNKEQNKLEGLQQKQLQKKEEVEEENDFQLQFNQLLNKKKYEKLLELWTLQITKMKNDQQY